MKWIHKCKKLQIYKRIEHDNKYKEKRRKEYASNKAEYMKIKYMKKEEELYGKILI